MNILKPLPNFEDFILGILLGTLLAGALIILFTVGWIPRVPSIFQGNGTSAPLPVYHYENITAIIQSKFTQTDWHNMIIGMQFVPFYDTRYDFFMSTNETITVSEADYYLHNIGDNFTYTALR